MDRVNESREEILERFKPYVEYLIKYLPWLEGKTGRNVSYYYNSGDARNSAFSVPVYDGTLLQFVEDASRTEFMDRNYPYIYTRYRMRDYKDEWREIEKADIMHMDVLCGILSKYVLGGMTKSIYWKNGVEYEIFYRVLKKAKEIMEFWEQPIEIDEEDCVDSQPVSMTTLSEAAETAKAIGQVTIADRMAAIAAELEALIDKPGQAQPEQAVSVYDDDDDLSLEEIQRILNGGSDNTQYDEEPQYSETVQYDQPETAAQSESYDDDDDLSLEEIQRILNADLDPEQESMIQEEMSGEEPVLMDIQIDEVTELQNEAHSPLEESAGVPVMEEAAMNDTALYDDEDELSLEEIQRILNG